MAPICAAICHAYPTLLGQDAICAELRATGKMVKIVLLVTLQVRNTRTVLLKTHSRHSIRTTPAQPYLIQEIAITTASLCCYLS